MKIAVGYYKYINQPGWNGSEFSNRDAVLLNTLQDCSRQQSHNNLYVNIQEEMIMKIRYNNLACEMSVSEKFSFSSQQICEYDKDTVSYAVQRIFRKSQHLSRACTYESWQYRLMTGRTRKSRKVMFVVPAIIMELPGSWVQLCGTINAKGVEIDTVRILNQYPTDTQKTKKVSPKIYVWRAEKEKSTGSKEESVDFFIA